MDINQFIQEVHQNAVEHGWWETDREIGEVMALIHSEWSEALEEYRAGRPMLWYAVNCDCTTCANRPVMHKEICEGYQCSENHKPEGIAVELIDGCIRIFDYFGKEDVRIRGIETLEQLMDTAPEETYKITLPRLISNLHLKTSQAYQLLDEEGSDEKMFVRGIAIMFEAVAVSCGWIKEQGHAPEVIMRMKHGYNRTRAYKHGGKTC